MLSLAISCCWMCGWVFVKRVSMLVHRCAIFSHMSWRLECLLRHGWVCLVLAVSVVSAVISQWGCKQWQWGSSGTHDHTQQVFQDVCECRICGRWRWMQKYQLTSERVPSLQENVPVMACSWVFYTWSSSTVTSHTRYLISAMKFVYSRMLFISFSVWKCGLELAVGETWCALLSISEDRVHVVSQVALQISFV